MWMCVSVFIKYRMMITDEDVVLTSLIQDFVIEMRAILRRKWPNGNVVIRIKLSVC